MASEPQNPRIGAIFGTTTTPFDTKRSVVYLKTYIEKQGFSDVCGWSGHLMVIWKWPWVPLSSFFCCWTVIIVLEIVQAEALFQGFSWIGLVFIKTSPGIVWWISIHDNVYYILEFYHFLSIAHIIYLLIIICITVSLVFWLTGFSILVVRHLKPYHQELWLDQESNKMKIT